MRAGPVALLALATLGLSAGARAQEDGEPYWEFRSSDAEHEELAALLEEARDLTEQLARATRAEEYPGQRDELETRRRWALQGIAARRAPLLDVIAVEPVAGPLVALAYQALAQAGAREESLALLEVVDAFGARTQARLLHRLGALAGADPGGPAERRLGELLALADRTGDARLGAIALQGLSEGGGAASVQPLLAALEGEDEAEAHRLVRALEELAGRGHARAVAEGVLELLAAGDPAPATRTHLHHLLGCTADPRASSYLLPWARQALQERRRAGPAADDDLSGPLRAGLEAVGRIGDGEAIGFLVDTYGFAADGALRRAVVRALGHARRGAADAGLVAELVGWLAEVERQGEGGAFDRELRRELALALRRLTGEDHGDRHAMWQAYLDRRARLTPP